AAQGAQTLPTTRGELYDQVLGHEENYWSTVYRDTVRDRAPRRARLRTAAACLSLVAAPEQDADALLTAVTDLKDDPRERHDVRDTLITCLRPAPGEGLALRPDPVGDHLVLRVLGADEDLLLRVIEISGRAALPRALITLVRAGQNDPDTATRLITRLLDADVERWPDVLAIAMTQGGAATASLEQLASRPDTPLPLDELSAALPFSSLGPYQLALSVDQRRLDAARAAGVEPATLAELLERVSARATLAGDRSGALTPSTEAVAIRRRLAQDSPAAHLPNLAASLNNLARCLSETGDRAGALSAITEAVGHYRRLAQDSPAAHLPNLAMALNLLAAIQADGGEHRRALDAFTAAAVGLAPGPRAELMLARARWLRARGDLADAARDLVEAAGCAQRESDPPWAGRSRRAVRAGAQEIWGDDPASRPPEVPGWAWRPLSDDVVAMLNAWLGAPGWEEREDLLRQHVGELSERWREELGLIQELYPDVETLGWLKTILDDAAARGLDTVLSELREASDHAELVQRWLATETWSESRALLQRHPELAVDPRTLAVLEAGARDAVVAQHLGIARLAARMPVAEVYDTVLDLDIAVDTAMGCVERGDAATLGDLLLAAPGLGRRPFVAPFLVAVHTVLTDTEAPSHDAAELMRAAAEQGNDTQRTAGAARLRRLARRRPQHAASLILLADILTTPNTSAATPSTPGSDPDAAASP
ncbi:MAG: hypothetical protein M3308_01440, partial [Actinomycetota bacterium]|nr:hypothetical protein [Actinomycetota bacterium]